MNTKKLVRAGVLSAIAFVLQAIGEVTPKVADVLAIEFSDFPAIIGAFALGPLWGVMIELIKNFLHFLVFSFPIGEFANLVVNGLFVWTIGMIYKYKKTKKGATIALITGTIVMAVLAIGSNVFIMLATFAPQLSLEERFTMALYIYTPFNLVKGAVLSVITLLSYKKLRPLLK